MSVFGKKKKKKSSPIHGQYLHSILDNNAIMTKLNCSEIDFRIHTKQDSQIVDGVGNESEIAQCR